MLSNSDKLTSELEKYASTDERKMIWVLLDGKNSNERISEITGLKVRTIQDYKKILENADLIENPYGKPGTRKINFVPSEWLGLVTYLDEGQ
jgi:hypothetical protein